MSASSSHHLMDVLEDQLSPADGSSASGGPVVHISDLQQWRTLTAQFLDHNYRQTGWYGLVSAERFRAQVERVAVVEGSQVIGVAEVRVKTVPVLGSGIAYIGGGPLTRRGSPDDLDRLERCLIALREEYLNRRRLTLRILPPLDPSGPQANQAICDRYAALGFEPSPWPPPCRTMVVNLDRPLPEIRKSLLQKWRNCLNNAERQGLTIRYGGEPELFAQFEELFNQFMDRKQISVELRAEFFRAVRQRAGCDDGYVISLACKDDQPIAGHLGSMHGDTAHYIQGATGELALKTKASNLLQWHFLSLAKQRGMRWYDLGGIEPETLPGVYHFKAGLNGQELRNPGPFQASPAGIRESLLPAMERFYRWTRRRERR
ncbi:lipid II:glycine glycyltransferase FemX [Fontivita pretiosa]|uniref:lipid II:glycine glycyltransferase FemX n=1 Tax=Fontivita pretiosa TaxID=2989684 RepID=UPI003D17D17C